MSGGSPALALKEEDVTKLLASSTHLGTDNLDFQMEQYVFKRRNDVDEAQGPKPKKQTLAEYRRSAAAQFFLEEEKQQSSSSGTSKEKTKKQTPVDCRRSTAAQFFVEEETVQHAATTERVVELLNDAIINKDNTLKNLVIVRELILQKEPQLLDNFLDEVVGFQHHGSVDVRKFVVSFIEEVCQKDPQILPKVIGNLIMMISQDTPAVQKRVIQAATQLYKVALKWLCSAKTVDEMMEALWASMVELRTKILFLLESENDGVRTYTVKFMEAVILAQTYRDEYAVGKEGEISLDDVPMILKIFRPRKMEEEAKEMFDILVAFHGASHISNFNLMTCIQSLSTIARKRFEFFPKVLQAFESLHANLPPTLGQSQVSSVRKTLKLQLMSNIVKHPAASEFYSQISTMLSDLGATPTQIAKCFPNVDQNKKRQRQEETNIPSKKMKADEEDDSKDKKSLKSADKMSKVKDTAIDITAEDLYPKLVDVNVADLVLLSLLSLPDEMPVLFQSSYTPIAAAGTEPQIRHLARLLATQLTIAGLGKGVEQTKAAAVEKMDESDEEEEESSKKIKTVVGGTIEKSKRKVPLVLLPTGTKVPRFQKQLNLLEITKPLTTEQSDNLASQAFQRILNSEKNAAKRGVSAMRSKILSTLATQFRGNINQNLTNYIVENPRGRIDLAFSWMYEEYIAYQGFISSVRNPISLYEDTVGGILGNIFANEEHKHALFSRFFVEMPYITLGMFVALKSYCVDENTAKQALHIAKSMTLRRPPRKLDFLGVISELTLHEIQDVRDQAVACAVELHEIDNLKPFIEAFASRSLKFLLQPVPPSDFAHVSSQPPKWTDDLAKICLHLYFALLPINHRLIHDLGAVYVETTPEIKRTILRALEAPVKGMSMHSPELLLFVENCPKGAETLVTRIIHVLTDKAAPSAELVSRVRDLYQNRVTDVRFLIPIINGLKKQEVIAALPELIKLNPTVVKEVFNRLLGSNCSSPLTPAELLVALHNIDATKCNLKTVIKATSLCFEEKNVYTQVVLAVVIQQLMEQNPLPILLMRTVIQSLSSYPHLLGFVTNILKRLIEKKVWTQKRIWEGFIKCCQRTKPQSFQVLLQLPAAQLQEVLQSSPDLGNPLCQHVDSFTDHQKAHIPQEVMDVISAFKPEVPAEVAPEADFEKPIEEDSDALSQNPE